MTKNEFYKGWSIMIFDCGLPGASNRLMMATKGGRYLDFPGIVADEEKAFTYAKQTIDKTENGEISRYENRNY